MSQISQAEARKYKQHSEWLNQAAWQLSVALGDIEPTETQHNGNLDDIMQRSIRLVMIGRSVSETRRRWWQRRPG